MLYANEEDWYEVCIRYVLEQICVYRYMYHTFIRYCCIFPLLCLQVHCKLLALQLLQPSFASPVCKDSSNPKYCKIWSLRVYSEFLQHWITSLMRPFLGFLQCHCCWNITMQYTCLQFCRLFDFFEIFFNCCRRSTVYYPCNTSGI